MSRKAESKKRGAPPGNQNARKHGFYSRVLDAAEAADYALATEVEGIDDEIALLRVKLKSVLRHDPDNVALVLQAVVTLARLLGARLNIVKRDRKGLKEAIENVLRDVAVPADVLKAAVDK